MSTEFRQFCSEHNIELHLIATGSSRANGQVERVMRTLKSLLTIVENDQHKVWRDEVNDIQLALNSTKSRVTGYSPTELMFGIKSLSLGESRVSTESDSRSRLDIDNIRAAAAANITRNAESEVQRFNRGKARVLPFSLGDFVFVKCSERNQTKLDRKFKGPFIITKLLENDRYELKGIGESSRLYKYDDEPVTVVCQNNDQIEEALPDDDDDTLSANSDSLSVSSKDARGSRNSDTPSVRSNTMSACLDTLSVSSYDNYRCPGMYCNLL